MPTPTQAAIYTAGDSDVSAWRAAVGAAGGSVSSTTYQAVSKAVRDLKGTGLWAKIYMLDLCCGADLTSSLVRQKVPLGIARGYTNTNFVAGDYTEATGRAGDGSTKYLDTLIDASVLGYSTSSLMLWAYTRTAIVGTGTTRMSIGAGATAGTVLGWVNTGSEEAVAIARVSTATELAGRVGTSTTGFLGGGTNGSRVATFYKNGSATGSTATETGSGFNNATFFVHASNNSTTGTKTPGQYNTRTISSSLITEGLSATEASTLYTIINTFETALGRNV